MEVLTGLLVLITGFYAWVTFKMLRANERVVAAMSEQTEAAYRPYVTVTPFLEPDNPIFYLRIANVGKTAALDLRLTLDKSFFKFGQPAKDIAKFSVFTNQIDAFPAGSEIVFALAQSFVVFVNDGNNPQCPTTFSVGAQYRHGAKAVDETHLIDLRPYLNADVPQDPYVRKLKDINETLAKIAAARNTA
ncbi:hypothetical protein [Rhodanobacter sp. B2A1Ga4]|uniref:hypothetical protein n=1 Tax=Rhodanobacter sp. B2A1Ga4 TaxID=2778647 RepID=UPI001B373C38|nr:hypothetical protein [Rhodanobacter sp. B2A1Ga4]